MFLARLFTGLAAVSLASALRVTPGSPCASKCGNTLDATTGHDMVCSKTDYASVTGVVFDECISCQRSSGYVSGNQSDMHWLLCKTSEHTLLVRPRTNRITQTI